MDKSLKERIDKSDLIIKEYFSLLGFSDIEEIGGKTLNKEQLKKQEIIKKYEDGEMRKKLSTKINYTYLKKLAPNYELKDESEIITITRFILKKLGYKLKSTRDFSEGKYKTIYVISENNL